MRSLNSLWKIQCFRFNGATTDVAIVQIRKTTACAWKGGFRAHQASFVLLVFVEVLYEQVVLPLGFLQLQRSNREQSNTLNSAVPGESATATVQPGCPVCHRADWTGTPLRGACGPAASAAPTCAPGSGGRCGGAVTPPRVRGAARSHSLSLGGERTE